MQLIKFITAGNVDDGKSTLIGRLLYDSNAISNDILENIQQYNGEINFAHLTDGLKSEREQGITIDVAYKYFTTNKRKFIIADCPGHKEYTRNMITGSSHADIAIILIDATQGITEQTKRHTFIADLLNIPCIVFCINKMDVVNYNEEKFQNIRQKINEFTFINIHQLEIIPISALKGDYVVFRSDNMQWYNGNTLLHVLESFQTENKIADVPAFMQVQYVAFQNGERYFYGNWLNGNIKTGDEITIFPGYQKNRVKDIFNLNKRVEPANSNQAVSLTLQEDTEVQRGYYFTLNRNYMDTNIPFEPFIKKEFSSVFFCLDQQSFIPGKRYFIQHHSLRTYLKCQEITEIFDLDELCFKLYENSDITMNTIFKAKFIAAQELLLADYRQCPELGTFILVDETSFKTVGAGIIMN